VQPPGFAPAHARFYTKITDSDYTSMTYSIEKSTIGAGFFIILDEEIIGWTATPWGARQFINKHARSNPIS